MRSNTPNKAMFRQIKIEFSGIIRTAVNWLKFGLSGRQWLASLLIGLLLLPVFSLPVQATAGATPIDENAKNFEPVNPPQWIWESAGVKLNAEIDEWLTPMRAGNAVADAETSAAETDTKKMAEKSVEKEAVAKAIEAETKEKEAVSTSADRAESATTAPETKSTENEQEELSKTAAKNNASATASKVVARRMMTDPPPRPITDEQLLPQLLSPQNNLGNPLGQTEAQSSFRALATLTRERAGIGNFNFDVPVASLPGRGMDASVGLSYNSQLWTKTTADAQDFYTYNADGNWMAPGFQIGYGYLDAYGNGAIPNQFVLIGSDGTRHQLKKVTNPDGSTVPYYKTDDGSFIEANLPLVNNVRVAKVNYTDGTRVEYGVPNTDKRRYPTTITDRHGNYISINYLTGDNVGRIASIKDTLGRDITFHYDSTQRLIAVTVPGFDGGTTVRQTIRFYYETLTLATTNRFNGEVEAPPTVDVLKYVYFPGTKTGYRYDYSQYYGMIHRIVRLEGMSVNGGSDLTQMGSVITTNHIESANTCYNYQGSPCDTGTYLPTGDVPKYNLRIDDWLGRTGSPLTTQYSLTSSVTNGTGTSTMSVTMPDGNKNITVSKVRPLTSWENGLTEETRLTNGAGTIQWAKTVLTWGHHTSHTVGSRNARVEKVETTNEAGQTRATVFGYDIYNNQTSISERDFAGGGQPGTELSLTEISYVIDQEYTYYNRLVRLPASIKKTVNSTVVSRTDYKYDEHPLTNRTNVAQYDAAYNQNNSQSYECNCGWVCDVYEEGGGRCLSRHWECQDPPCNTYDSHRNARGNVTKIIAFHNPLAVNETADLNASKTTFKYDITGNPTEASLSCCNVKTWDYNDTNQFYAPVSETKGAGTTTLTTNSVYNFPTGLVTKTTDENSQETFYEYETDTLRRKKVIYPNGGYTQTEYSDKVLESQPSLLVPGFVRTTTTLETNKTTASYNYFDARGLPIRSATLAAVNGWTISAVEYDNLGRAKKSYNPFDAPAANSTIPNNQKYTEVTNYDGLGRATEVKLQDNTTVNTFYDEAAVTYSDLDNLSRTGTATRVKDQAGKERRQIVDALGRVIRVDEPDIVSNGIGTVGSPTQPSHYYYDGNDNLSRTIQSDGTTTQERLFKYDALSRLTHERQIEANAKLNDNGGVITSGGAWTKVLKYNTHNLLVDRYDARGVNTHFTYDGINRVESVTFTDGTPTVKYTYDQRSNSFSNKGALTRVETELTVTTPADTPTTATEFDYDNMGRVTKHRQTIGTQIYNQEYAYNLAGQLTSQIYPSGKVVTYGYDTNGRLSNIGDQSRTFLNNVNYSAGNLNSLILGNSTAQNFAYNDRLQLAQQNLTHGSEVLQDYYYGYGQIDQNGSLDATKNNGQLGRIESKIAGQSQWSQKFKYDSLGRLSGAEELKGATTTLSYKQKFDFDRFGNLYRKAGANPTTGQENPLPYTAVEETDISKSKNQFTTNTIYDDAGNVTQDTKIRNLKFAYDANGRMIKTSNIDDTNQANSVYDAKGLRVAVRTYDVWKFFIYDAFGKLISEYGGLSATDDGGVKYVFTDWQGSTRAIVSNSGFVQARQDFTAFGEQIAGNIGLRASQASFVTSNSLNQKYALTEKDQASGLEHTWWRKLEGKAGRWTSPDPYNGSMNLGDPQSFNRYSYVENQPTNYIDPSGLCGFKIFYETDEEGKIIKTRVVVTPCYVTVNGGNTANNGGGGGGGGGRSRYSPMQDSDGGFGVIRGIRGIIREGAEAGQAGLECLRAAQNRANARAGQSAQTYPLDRRLAFSATTTGVALGGLAFGGAVATGVGSPAAPITGAVGAIGGAGGVIIPRVSDRLYSHFENITQWRRDTADCGFPGAVPSAYIPRGI